MQKTQNAYLTLRQAILDCDLAPGSSLVISSLKARFGFGWTPLREALSRLEADKLVTSAENKGYRVAPVSKEQLLDLQLARKTVERLLLARSIERGGEAWEASIVGAHHLLAQAPQPAPGMPISEIEIWERRHQAFHETLLAAAEAPWMSGFAAETADHLHRHHRAMLYQSGLLEDAERPGKDALKELIEATLGIAHHTELMDAVLRRVEDEALSLMDEHVGFSMSVYQAL